MSDKPLQIVLLNYDWRDLMRTDPGTVTHRYARDQLRPELNNFFVVSWSREDYQEQITDNIRVVHLRARFSWLRPWYDFLFALRAPKIVADAGISPDVVIVYETPLLFAARRVQRRVGGQVVFSLTHLPIEYSLARKFGWIKAVYAWLMLHTARSCIDYVYTINDTVKEYIMKHMGVPESKIRVFVSDTIKQDLRTMVPLEYDDARTRIRKKHNIQATHIFFSVGRIIPEKGFDRLLRALAQVKDLEYHLLIAGGIADQAHMESLTALAKKLGIATRVTFIGQQSREEMWTYYAGCDAFLLFSRAEALGLVVWEAMYAGCPVLCSRASGIVESVGAGEERGYLWEEADSVEVFAQKLRLITSQSKDVEQKKSRARTYVEEKLQNTYSINNLVEEFV